MYYTQQKCVRAYFCALSCTLFNIRNAYNCAQAVKCKDLGRSVLHHIDSLHGTYDVL